MHRVRNELSVNTRGSKGLGIPDRRERGSYRQLNETSGIRIRVVRFNCVEDRVGAALR